MRHINYSPTDITHIFPHKTGVYKSHITECETIITFKKVEKYEDTFGGFFNLFTSTNGVRYRENELKFPA